MSNATVKGSTGCIACLYTNWSVRYSRVGTSKHLSHLCSHSHVVCCVSYRSEPYPWVHAVASVLSAGPTAPGDQIGTANVSLVMRTCTDDGTLLKPDRPATPLDSYWRVRAFGASVSGPQGEVWTTETTILGGDSGHTWTYALGTMLAEPYSLTLAELTAATTAWPANYANVAAGSVNDTQTSTNAGGEYVVWDYWAGAATATVFSDPIVFPAGVDYGAARFVIAAPVLSNGWAVLGETGKFIAVARQRFTEITVADDASVRVRMKGSASEEVSVAARNPQGVYADYKCTLGVDGTVTLSLPHGSCA